MQMFADDAKLHSINYPYSFLHSFHAVLGWSIQFKLQIAFSKTYRLYTGDSHADSSFTLAGCAATVVTELQIWELYFNAKCLLFISYIDDAVRSAEDTSELQ